MYVLWCVVQNVFFIQHCESFLLDFGIHILTSSIDKQNETNENKQKSSPYIHSEDSTHFIMYIEYRQFLRSYICVFCAIFLIIWISFFYGKTPFPYDLRRNTIYRECISPALYKHFSMKAKLQYTSHISLQHRNMF